MSRQHSQQEFDSDGGGVLVSNKPDHGDLFIPGAESAPQGLAPQPLDHFKRGYKERAELREREMGHLQQDFDRRPASSTTCSSVDHNRRHHVQKHSPFIKSSRGYYSDERYPLGSEYRMRSSTSVGSHNHGNADAAGERECGHNLHRNANNTSHGNDHRQKSHERFGNSRDYHEGTEVTHRKRYYDCSPSNDSDTFSKYGSKRPHFSTPEDKMIANHNNDTFREGHRGIDQQRGYNIISQEQGDVGFSGRGSYDDDRERERHNQRGRGHYNSSNYSSVSLMGFDVSELVDRLCFTQISSIPKELEVAREHSSASFDTGKAVTAILSSLARRKEMNVALSVWNWMDVVKIKRNVFHFNALISVCEKCKNYHLCMKLLSQMEHEKCNKNEVTFSSAISTCEKTGQWQRAIDLLHQMKSEGIPQTAIAYNAAISACEKVRCFKSNQAKLPILYFFSQSIAILFLNRL